MSNSADNPDSKKTSSAERTPLLQQDQSYFPVPPNAQMTNPTAVYGQYDQQAGYYPAAQSEAAAAAAASLAAYQQQQASMYYGATGAPPPLVIYPQQQQFAMPPPSPGAAGGSASASRPPRATRRSSPSRSQVQVPQQQMNLFPPQSSSPVYTTSAGPVPAPTGYSQWVNMEDRDRQGSSSIPPLQDIFSNDQGFSNYGAIPNVSAQGGTDSPIIWNAPASNKSKVQPFLITASSPGRTNKGSSKRNRNHRRSNSDLPLRPIHRRAGSAGTNSDLPPTGHRRMGSESGIGRPRTYSTGSQSRPKHKRNPSLGSVGTFSSNMSAISVVSNIAKSSMFGGIDETTGKVVMHFPFEAVRLVFVNGYKDSYSQLRQGHLYLNGNATDFDDFEEYNRITNAMEEGLQPQWESLEKPTNICECVCNHCNGCMGKQQLLSDPNYLLAVDSDIYKKVVGEISDAHAMPCGLFFCGHHEDSGRPRIAIAMAVVTILFLSMAYVAFFVEGS